jgi:ApbE superfamily uncharacterized protein (UPF0280 family)
MRGIPVKDVNLKRRHFELRETIITLISDDDETFGFAEEAVRKVRAELEDYIACRPEFLHSLEPVDGDGGAPQVVRRMISASRRVEVGPMAAVAGTIAWIAVEAMSAAGAKTAIVDNGGDVALVCDRPLFIGLFPTSDLSFEIEPTPKPVGICTSSGTIGPSISLGVADAAIVVSKDVSLADAGATALGNSVKECAKKDIEKAFDDLKHVNDIEGAMVIAGNEIGMWGDLPRLKKRKVNRELITRGSPRSEQLYIGS